MLVAGCAEEIPLRTLFGRIAEALVKGGVKRDGVKRHLDVDRGGELGADAAHALSGGPLALGGLALDDENVFAAGSGEVVGDAGADDSAADDDDFCALHRTENCSG